MGGWSTIYGSVWRGVWSSAYSANSAVANATVFQLSDVALYMLSDGSVFGVS